jgi:hypothetical protein
LRAYWKNSFLKQYEKFACFLETNCSNNLRDFGLKKGLDHLDAVRKRFQIVSWRSPGVAAPSNKPVILRSFSRSWSSVVTCADYRSGLRFITVFSYPRPSA